MQVELNETDQYEPLSQQIYNDLVKEIDRLFDALKNDLSIVFGLHWEWQKAVIKHSGVISESYVAMPLSTIVVGKKIINELRYELRESADKIVKINQVIELYRDKLKDLVKKTIFRPKTPTPDEAYKQNQRFRNNPAIKQSMQGLLGHAHQQLARSALDDERAKLDAERQEFEKLRGTGGAKASPGVEPKIGSPGPPPTGKPPEVTPEIKPPVDATKTAPPAPAKPEAAPMPTNAAEAKPAAPEASTASPNITDPKERDRILKTGYIVNEIMRKTRSQQVEEAEVDVMLKKLTGTGKIEDLDISHVDADAHEQLIKIGQAYMALHGGGETGELETGQKPAETAEKDVAELLTMPNKKLVDYLSKLVSPEAVDEVKKEFRGVPRVPENRQSFIEKILAKRVKKEWTELSVGKQLRVCLRNGIKPKVRLENVENKVGYLIELLRKTTSSAHRLL